jgi:hypothetical protein
MNFRDRVIRPIGTQPRTHEGPSYDRSNALEEPVVEIQCSLEWLKGSQIGVITLPPKEALKLAERLIASAGQLL